MPRRALTLEQKLHNAIDRRESLLRKYNGDKQLLTSRRYEYTRTKDLSLKPFYTDYNNLIQLNKTIRDLETILTLPTGNSSEDNGDNTHCNEDLQNNDRILLPQHKQPRR